MYTLVFGSVLSCFSLYVVPVSAEFGLSRAEMNTAYALISLGSGLWAPFIGRALDYLSLKLIMAISATLLGIGFVSLALSTWIWVSVLALATAISIGLDGAATLTLSVLVARWFRANRARALTLSITGQALGKVIMPLPTVLLIESFGWRAALFVTGIALTAILLLVARFVRENPRPGELEPDIETDRGDGDADDADPVQRPLGVLTLLAMPHFWLIALSMALILAISASFAVSVVPVGLEFGLSMTVGAALASVFASAAFIAKILLATFADKVDRFVLTTMLLLVGIPLSGSYLLIDGQTMLFVFAFLFGLFVGGFAALFPILQVDVFGLASYGTARGLMIPFQSIFVAIGAWVAGEIYDLTGNYRLMFATYAAALVVAAGMLWTSRSLYVRARARAGAADRAEPPHGARVTI
ncbi:MAG TPA: MFS transporter [Allosphingosinicella sp.]|nr:MFS transporter [Allosphingosinicella sp.]